MRLEPISPSPYCSTGRVFTAACAKCQRAAPSNSLAADLDGAPFTFVCWACWPGADRDRLRLANDEAFRRLTPAQQREARLSLFGASETRGIEKRISREQATQE
jgi:hypothetical protein